MHEQDSDSEFLFHTSCPACGSSDANSVYSDGHTYCFACSTYTKGDGEAPTHNPAKRHKPVKDLIPLEEQEFTALRSRGITEETCRRWGYGVAHRASGPVHVANYRTPEGDLVGQKIRTPDKDFSTLGAKHLPLYGSHLWGNGRKLICTEGELDALAVSQVQDHKWPVVSLPNGADGAVKAIKRNMEYVQQFDEVVLMLDNDDPGREAAEAVGLLLPPGTCKIATLPRKDPCECLRHNEGQAIIRAIWNAKEFRPDGVVAGSELRERTLNASHKVGIPYPYACLNGPTCGIHKGKVVVVTAGTGIGKSTLTREIAYDLSMRHHQNVGMLMLEEGVEETALSLCGIHVSLPLLKDRSGISDEDLGKAFDEAVGNGRVYMYDHWGSKAVNAILQRIRYMHHGCGCDYFILDHISILVAALDDKDGRIDERKMIDMGMTELRTLAEELGITIFVVSHLSRSKDSKHEEGGQISLRDLRGSHAIAQVADLIVALERNQQADADSDGYDVSRIRILKNRLTGETGLVGELVYDKATGRLTERDPTSGYFQAEAKTDAAGDFTPSKSADEPAPTAEEFFGSGTVEDWREEAQEGSDGAQKEERPKTTAEEIEEGDEPSESPGHGADPKPVNVTEALDIDWLL